MWLGLYNPTAANCDDSDADPAVWCDGVFQFLDGTPVENGTHYSQAGAQGSSQCVRGIEPRVYDDTDCGNEFPSMCEFNCPLPASGSAYEGLSGDHNCVALGKTEDGHAFEMGPCSEDAYYICQTGKKERTKGDVYYRVAII